MPKVNLKRRSGNTKSLDECFREFILSCRVKNLSQKTMKYYEDGYYYFKGFLGDYSADNAQSITKAFIQEYTLYLMNETGNNDRSIKTRLSGLRTFLYYLMREGELEQFTIQIPKVHQKEKETYTDDELKRLLKRPKGKPLDFTEYRTWVIINVLLGTGCRSSNISTLHVKDVDFESGFLKFRTTKNKKFQLVPMSYEVESILREYVKVLQGQIDEYLFPSIYGVQLTYNALAISIAKYNHSRGVSRRSIHAFRHTFAKHWIMNGGDVFRLQKILGHSSLDMVRNYVNLYSSDVAKDFEKFNPLSKFTESKGMHKIKL